MVRSKSNVKYYAKQIKHIIMRKDVVYLGMIWCNDIMSLNTSDEGYNNGKKCGKKGAICGPNNGIPPFDGSNFDYWKNRMETYLKALGADVWISFASGYNASKKPKTSAQKEEKRNNKMTIDTILDGLTDSVKSKVGSCA
jgi:hypothetical protein